MEPIEFLRILRRRWRVLTACALIGATAALLASPSGQNRGVAAPSYKATAYLLTKSVKGADKVSLQQDALLLTVGVVPVAAANKLHFSGNPRVLANRTISSG